MMQVFLPKNLPECWDILDQEPDAMVYAGGTDLLVQRRLGDIAPRTLVCLERVAELQGVQEGGAYLRIGAGSTHGQLLRDPLVQKHLPVLIKALKTLGSPLIRNMGTIGGNICTASPAGDTLPPLYILDAELELRSRTGMRAIPIQDFITGPGTTDMKRGEILTVVRVKNPEGYNIHHYEKIGQRRALACAITSMAALIGVSETGVIAAARLAWGSVAPTVAVFPNVEAVLIGQRLSQAVLEQAATLVRKTVSPIDDVRASAAYRREVAGNLLLKIKGN